jgi:hypothetical protein
MIFLTILIFGTYYFLTKEDPKIVPEIDLIKLKMSASTRHRQGPIVPVEETKLLPGKLSAITSVPENLSNKPQVEVNRVTHISDLEHVEEVELSDVEEGWNNELKEMLNRLEPADGETIHKAYISQQESYQAELDALLSEKQQKTTDDALQEVEQLISQIDQKHQEKLKEILGAHYEAVRDGYETYMESAEEN